jgi:hypothetical protein
MTTKTETTAKKNIWQQCKADNLPDFFTMLENYALDPIFLNYGKYLYKYELSEYSPKLSPEAKKEIEAKQAKNLYKLSANFSKISFGTSDIPDLTEAQAKQAKKRIDKNINSPEFQKQLREKFNCITVEKTDYYNFMLGGGKWYNYLEIGGFISINSTKEEIQKFLESTIKNDTTKSPKAIKTQYRLKYCEKYFRNQEERVEFNKYIRGLNLPLGAPAFQFNRSTESQEKNLIDFKFESTGRKLKLFVSTYMTFFKEVDPIFTNTPTD